MYAIQLEDGSWLSINGKRLWFKHKVAAYMLVADIGGKVWDRNDFEYQI